MTPKNTEVEGLGDQRLMVWTPTGLERRQDSCSYSDDDRKNSPPTETGREESHRGALWLAGSDQIDAVVRQVVAQPIDLLPVGTGEVAEVDLALNDIPS